MAGIELSRQCAAVLVFMSAVAMTPLTATAAPPDPPNAFNVGQFNNLTIAATQSIFSAGLRKVAGDGRCGAGTNGTLPTEIAVPPNAVWVSYETVSVARPIGSVDNVVDPYHHSGDGWSAFGADATNIFGPVAVRGVTYQMGVDISGIKAPGSMFLTGAFRDAATPTSTANSSIRDYMPTGWIAGSMGTNLESATFGGDMQKIFAKTNQATYTDLALNQSYWIGDGRDQFQLVTGAQYWSPSQRKDVPIAGAPAIGNVQYFKIPAGATRLYLGFSDAAYFYGTPGCYGDNPGALNVSGTFWGPKLPVLTVACTPAALNDSPGNVATCTVTSDDPAPAGGLSVALTPPAVDPRYSAICTSPLTIDAGKTTATCTITATANTVVGDGSVTATLTLLAGSGYTLGATPSATVTISDDDKPPVVAAVQPVPALGDWALMVLGLAVTGFAARRMRRA